MILVLILPERPSATLSYESEPSNLPLPEFKFVQKSNMFFKPILLCTVIQCFATLSGFKFVTEKVGIVTNRVSAPPEASIPRHLKISEKEERNHIIHI